MISPQRGSRLPPATAFAGQGCPKHMVMGPCGGVRPDGGCQPPPDWSSRVEAVERELHRRYGHTPELTEADEQSGRIGRLLSSGQLTSQVILLQAVSTQS
jgi:hypothetical protein